MAAFGPATRVRPPGEPDRPAPPSRLPLRPSVEQSSAIRPRPRNGQELTLTVDTLAFGGAGVARLDGYVVFVQGAIPGDTVRAVVRKSKRAYAEARVLEVVQASPDRLEPVAAHPGAPWQVLPYARAARDQAGAGRRRVAPDRKARWLHAGADRAGARSSGATATSSSTRSATTQIDRLVCGFHAPGRWEEIVEDHRLPARLGAG